MAQSFQLFCIAKTIRKLRKTRKFFLLRKKSGRQPAHSSQLMARSSQPFVFSLRNIRQQPKGELFLMLETVYQYIRLYLLHFSFRQSALAVLSIFYHCHCSSGLWHRLISLPSIRDKMFFQYLSQCSCPLFLTVEFFDISESGVQFKGFATKDKSRKTKGRAVITWFKV